MTIPQPRGENKIDIIYMNRLNNEDPRNTVEYLDKSNNRTVAANIFRKAYKFLCTRKFTQIFCVVITLVEFILYGIDRTFHIKNDYSVVAKFLFVDCDKPVWHIWRFFTYILVHQSFNHIAYNLGHQIVFGMILELGSKWWPICLIYFGGAAAGSLIVFSFFSFNNLVGCSGGVFSIVGATLCCLIKNQRSNNPSPYNGFFRLVTIVLIAVTFTREICVPEVVPNQFIIPLYESSLCRINSEISVTTIVHLTGLLWGIINFILMEYLRSGNTEQNI